MEKATTKNAFAGARHREGCVCCEHPADETNKTPSELPGETVIRGGFLPLQRPKAAAKAASRVEPWNV